MKIVRCIGGLGNQMFQYAFYKSLESRYADVKFDISPLKNYKTHNGFELSKVFSVNFCTPSFTERISLSFRSGGFIFRLLRHIYKKKRAKEYIEKGLFYQEDALSTGGNLYYIGYWQSWKYIRNIDNTIKRDFRFDEKKLPESSCEILSKIRNTNSVSLHIRRGDYLGNPVYDHITTPDYYNNAIDYIKKNVENPFFFIFTNDPEWCKVNLTLPNSLIVDVNSGMESYWDMFLMSQCKHNIIANSSFSWWGAWLNEHENKIVIAPRKWINEDSANIDDIIPPTWNRI